MRVLHVYSGNLYGGVESLLTTLAGMTGSSNDEAPQFALCYEGRLSEQLRSAGARLHMLPAARASRPWTVLHSRRKMRRLLERERFDVAVCHSAWPWAVFASTLQKTGVPAAFYQHDALTGRHWVERWAGLTSPRLAIANSAFTAGTLTRVFPGKSAEVVYCPVPAPSVPATTSDRAKLRAEFNTPAGDVVIVQTSRFEPWKGHALHLEALGRLHDLPAWTLWIAGGAQRPHEHDYLNDLKASAQRLGIGDRIRFIGARRDIAQVLFAADIHCQPNTGPEPFGLAFIEAMDAGLPVVTTAMGGPLEFIDDSCGILVRPEAAALSDALRRLIQSPEARARLGAGGPRKARALCDPGVFQMRLDRALADMAGKASP